jgi:hypothetical protein
MKQGIVRRMLPVTVVAVVAAVAFPAVSYAQKSSAPAKAPTAQSGDAGRLAAGPQYDSTHVYVATGQQSAFVTSWEATFGGTNSTPVLTDVTPTPSETESEIILSPVGTLSVFGFTTPIPYPFGAERGGWLVTNLNEGVSDALADGGFDVVSPFDDPIGQDTIVQFPGGVDFQLYIHDTAPSYPALTSVPQSRIYLTPSEAGPFLSSYLRFTGGRIVSDDKHADAGEIGLPGQTYRRVAITSPFGDTLVLVSDGQLPYPFGRETTGYGVTDLSATLAKAQAAGATILYGPYASSDGDTAIVQFPGGYIAEVHQAR